jgi:hypothetical protein
MAPLKESGWGCPKMTEMFMVSAGSVVSGKAGQFTVYG